MDTSPRFDPYGDQPREKPRRNWLSTCLIGCLILVVAGLILAGLAAYWIGQNWRGLVSDFSAAGVAQIIDDSDLPPQEKQEIKAQVDRVADAFRTGRLSGEQVRSIVENLMKSPLLATIVVSAVDKHYFSKSGLSEEEQAEGRKTLQRFVRGSIDGTISKDSMDVALAHVAERQSNGSWRLRSQVTDEQLRAFLSVAKAKADEANVPAEPPAFDPSDEVKRIINEAINEPAEAPLPDPERP